jgi:hypothetical protein
MGLTPQCPGSAERLRPRGGPQPPVTSELHTVTFGSDAVLAKGGYAEKLAEAVFSPLPGTGQSGPPVLGIYGVATGGEGHLHDTRHLRLRVPSAHTFMKGQIVVV